jgi:DoxX-like family
MAEKIVVHKIIKFCIASIWVANGLFCKVLNFVPRHERIVARILGDEHAVPLTKAIGIAEIFMAVWILSNIKSRLNAVIQILIVATMNCIEFVLAPDLLLWGKVNSIFALMFILVIYSNEFVLNKKLALQT